MQNVTKELSRWTLLLLAATSMLACSQQNEKATSINQELSEDSSQGIVGGSAVRSNDVYGKSTVALYLDMPLREGGTKLINFCTGTLIADELVLTAAHCFADFAQDLGVSIERLRPYLRVGFGTKIAKDLQDTSVEFRSLKAISVHKDYQIGSVGTAAEESMEDIALVRLNDRAPASAQTAALPGDESHLEKGKAITLVGFGLTNGREQTRATRMNRVTVKIDNPRLTAAQFSYSVENRKSACSGDSGGPAYVRNRAGKVFVIGVTSWGDMNCEELGAYTSVSAFLPWIMETATILMAQ